MIYEQNDQCVQEALQKFEQQEYSRTGVSKLSGGFSVASIKDKDEDYFYINLKWGVQDGDENTVHTEQWKMCRSTMRVMPN